MRLISIFVISSLFSSCGYYYGHSYDFEIVNNLKDDTVKIVPLEGTHYFWITNQDTFTVLPGTRFLIASLTDLTENEEAEDLFDTNELIIDFELYINSELQTKDFTIRSAWVYSQGSVPEMGKYSLILNESSFQ